MIGGNGPGHGLRGPRGLALVAVVLATGALVADTAGVPTTGGTTSPSRITAIDLAERIREGRSVTRVIDVRTPADFEIDHIATAANIPLETIAARPITGPGFLVVYDEGGQRNGEAERAARILGQAGPAGVHVLEGGMVAWVSEVLRPTIADNATQAERARFEETAALSRWFDGMPRVVPAAQAERAKTAGAGAIAAEETPRIRRRGC
jgi:rhodanese-related sulfurtransferase